LARDISLEKSSLMEVPSIKRTSATEEAFKALHDMITSGRLKHGDKLPSQDRLAEQFGVSRNTIREAINRLTIIGLLSARQGVGTLINANSPSEYIASLSGHFLLQPSTVREFMEARVIIEMATVRLAVMRADEPALAELEENVLKQKEAIRKGDVEAFIKHDVEFHFSLARASGNKVLVQFLGAVTDLLSTFIREVCLLPRATRNALSFHRDILKFIRARDADAAERKLIEHLTDVVKNIEKSTGSEVGTAFYFMAGKRQPEEDSCAVAADKRANLAEDTNRA
jgi:GntR family transcriptional repressor for pyruvate dehydrogenase complex